MHFFFWGVFSEYVGFDSFCRKVPNPRFCKANTAFCAGGKAANVYKSVD
jgi:hypothetical protein